MWKWLFRAIGFVFAALIALFIVIIVRFQGWEAGIKSELLKNSTIAQTARGPIEYAEIGQGPAVLVVHGTPGGYDGDYASLKIVHAEQDGFRYVIPSRPGYLRTPLNVGVTPADQADAFAALLDKLGIQKTAVIAHSGGGPSALQFALRYPDRCSALVLVAALVRNYSGPPPQVPKSPAALWTRDLLIYGFAGLARLKKADPPDPQWPALVQAALRSVVPYKPRLAGVENDLVQETKLSGWPINKISCPTLILQGTADQSVPLADAEYAHQQISGSELVEVAGQDHMMELVKHKELDAKILDFLRRHP